MQVRKIGREAAQLYSEASFLSFLQLSVQPTAPAFRCQLCLLLSLWLPRQEIHSTSTHLLLPTSSPMRQPRWYLVSCTPQSYQFIASGPLWHISYWDFAVIHNTGRTYLESPDDHPRSTVLAVPIADRPLLWSGCWKRRLSPLMVYFSCASPSLLMIYSPTLIDFGYLLRC